MAKRKRRRSSLRARPAGIDHRGAAASPSKPVAPPKRRRIPVSGVAGFALGAAVLLALAVYALRGGFLSGRSLAGTVSRSSAPAPGQTATSQARVIDGIPCTDEDVTYHEHAYLQLVDAGRNVPVPANIGIVDDTCVYYLHTHDNSGELHMEAPRYTYLTLGNFFDIWGKPLSRHQAGPIVVRPGQTVRTYVDRRLYHGDPRAIELKPHRLIAIEVGRPFVPPSTFDFQGD